jgi:hypothetical protein
MLKIKKERVREIGLRLPSVTVAFLFAGTVVISGAMDFYVATRSYSQ